MDIFVEQIIRRRFSPIDYLICAGCLLGGVIIMLAGMMFIPSFVPIIFVGICVGAYYLITSRSLEFEYSATNGDLTFDKIINRRKRKRVVSFDVHELESIGPYKKEEHASKRYDKQFFTGTFADGRDCWCIATRTPKYGSVLVVFDPDEKVLKAIKPFLPRQLQLSAFGRN